EVIHHDNCFHRDIAPDNILLLADGRPLLLDFGAARRVIGDRTQALTVILKPGYAPLEQYAEDPHVKQGAWTDIYALAAVVYNAITCRPPMASVARSINDTMVPLSKAAAGRYSTAFLQAMDRALAVRPEDRPRSVAEFRALLAVQDTPVTPAGKSSPTASPQAPATKGKGRAMWLVGIAGTALAIAGGAFYTLRSAPDAPSRPLEVAPANRHRSAYAGCAGHGGAGSAQTRSYRRQIGNRSTSSSWWMCCSARTERRIRQETPSSHSTRSTCCRTFIASGTTSTW
ncbi:MAG: hypothetical protein IPL11_14165, partial [Candidatus Accumulibacter sp.]|nr:hypothetical protein [Accumulibacter sp.]